MVPIYSNNNDVLISCNSTDLAIWRNVFKNESTVTTLLSPSYSNTQQRVIFPDLVVFECEHDHIEYEFMDNFTAVIPIFERTGCSM